MVATLTSDPLDTTILKQQRRLGTKASRSKIEHADPTQEQRRRHRTRKIQSDFHCWRSRLGIPSPIAAFRHSAGAGTQSMYARERSFIYLTRQLCFAIILERLALVLLEGKHGFPDQIWLARALRVCTARNRLLKIEGHIQVAENAIRMRLHEFSMDHGGTPEENQAVQDALHGLDILRKEVAAWRERAS
jgi:hypothetical protein